MCSILNCFCNNILCNAFVVLGDESWLFVRVLMFGFCMLTHSRLRLTQHLTGMGSIIAVVYVNSKKSTLHDKFTDRRDDRQMISRLLKMPLRKSSLAT